MCTTELPDGTKLVNLRRVRNAIENSWEVEPARVFAYFWNDLDMCVHGCATLTNALKIIHFLTLDGSEVHEFTNHRKINGRKTSIRIFTWDSIISPKTNDFIGLALGFGTRNMAVAVLEEVTDAEWEDKCMGEFLAEEIGGRMSWQVGPSVCMAIDLRAQVPRRATLGKAS